MPPRQSKPHVTVEVTPRFEVFYALQVLESGVGERLAPWRREMERRLPARARTEIARVAPSPLLWPLLADALRDEPPRISFAEMISALRAMDDNAFRRAVLCGVFKAEGAVDGLMSGRVNLKRTIAGESESRRKLLILVGLHPFDARNACVHVFQRIVSQPAMYRDEVIGALDTFWQVGFSETWETLESQMMTSARAMKTVIARRGFESFALERELPVTVSSPAADIHVIPSAFNISKLWASYADSHGRMRYFVPVLDRTLSLGVEAQAPETPTSPQRAISIEPSVVFKALGDTTRYAIATTLARTPMTSVELARVFKVSKPTISHHVQQLRAANLLTEQQGENGTVLSLNRRVLENASAAAAAEMFSEDGPDHVVKRSRRYHGDK